MKKLVIPAVLLVIVVPFVLVLSLYFYNMFRMSRTIPMPNNYEDCTKVKGAVIQETYPPVCRLLDGRTFTQDLKNIPSSTNPDDLPPVKMNSVFEMLTNTQDIPNRKIIRGTLFRGNEIDRGYCSSGIYLKDDSGKIQLRAKNLAGDIQLFDDPKSLGKYVELLGVYTPNKVMCEALICECDDYYIVENLEVLEQ